MKSRNRAMLLVGLLVLLSVVFAVKWWNARGPIDRVVRAVECPHYWGHANGGPNAGEQVALLSRDSLPLAGLQTDQPEYNDCQRFIVMSPGGPTYGAIQAIFTRFRLDSAYSNPPALSIQRRGASGDLGDVVFPAIGLPRLVHSNSSGRVHVMAIGEVYSEGDYADLGIVAGYDCIILAWDEGQKPVRQAAWMVSVGKNAAACVDDPLSFNKANAVLLHVTAVATLSDARGTDAVPPVSRWDWDDVNKVHYAGILCPTGWCELSKNPRYHSSVSYAAPNDLDGPDRRVVRQKGWYDEQYLATISAGGKAVLRPDAVMGTVFPEPGLAGRTMTNYTHTGWQTVAWVSLDRESNVYKSKYGYDVAPVATVAFHKHNRVDLCFAVAAGDCLGVSSSATGGTKPTPLALPTNCIKDVTHKGTWFARVTGARDGEKTFCVLYRPSPDHSQPPGTVRWRWTLKDETIWVPCPIGCCEADAIM